MKSGKTPYEIRLDLLTLAYSIVKGKKDAACAINHTGMATDPIRITEAPATEEIVAEAEKLNKFVSQSIDK